MKGQLSHDQVAVIAIVLFIAILAVTGTLNLVVNTFAGAWNAISHV